MRRAGDVCFSEVYREGGGKLDLKPTLQFLLVGFIINVRKPVELVYSDIVLLIFF
jgi:hypothetical protein